MNKIILKKRGFTLIEVLVVIGIIAILSAIVLVAVNPSRQFKLARDSQRTSNVNAILNAVQQNMAEHRGLFMCDNAPHDLPDIPMIVKSDQSKADIAKCIVPDYISSLPYDPSKTGAFWNDESDYDTEYVLWVDSEGRVTASSTGELTANISVTR